MATLVTGQVTSAQNMRPLEGAQVSIEGTGMGGLANKQGRYLLLNVPAGTYTIRVTMIGFGTSREQPARWPPRTSSSARRRWPWTRSW